MVRNSLNYVSWKMRAEVAADLKRIYTCATVNEAEQMLGGFEDKWDDAYLPISQSWRRNWSRIIPFFDYTPEIRKVIYALKEVPLGDTTNAIESVNIEPAKNHQEPRFVPERRRATETVLSGPAQHQQKMDNADSGLESGADSLYYPVRRPNEQPLTETPFTQNSGHPRRRV